MGRVHGGSADLVDLSTTSRKFLSVSIRVFSTPDMISLITFWRGLAPGLSFSPRRCGSSSPWTKPKTAPSVPPWSAWRFGPSGAAQSRQRKGEASDGEKSAPTASACSSSRASRSSRIRRKRIHVSSGTY
jgi:hypothetical protein